MTLRPPERPRTRARERRHRLLRWAGAALAAAILFLVGLALGRALEEGPAPEGPRTVVRTFEPAPAGSGPSTATVTVTVTVP